MSEFKFSINLSTLRNIPVSFIIHTRDSFQNTSFLLENIITKVYNPIEIILLNDKSLNKEYFNQIVDKYKFIRLINNDQSYADAINMGLDNCSNDWIMYINSVFKPNNSMWSVSLFNTMQSLKSQGVKLISPFISNNSFFNYYKEYKKDVILEDHFLPFNIAFFHKDLFRTIGSIDKSDDLVDISSKIYNRMNKRNYKQAISRNSLFI